MDRTRCELNGKYDNRDVSTTQCDYKSSACEHINIFKKDQEGLKIYNTIHSHFIACTTPAYRRLKIVNTRCHQCGGRGRLHSCLHCVYFGCYNGHVQDHHKKNNHYLYADLTYGNLLCLKCGDYEYDDELAQIAENNIIDATRFLNDDTVNPFVKLRLKTEKIDELAQIAENNIIDATRFLNDDKVDPFVKLRLKTEKIIESFKFESHTPVGLRPFVNSGNTCFMNSIVQILMHTPLLRYFLLSGSHKCRNPKKICLMCELSDICHNYYNGGDGVMGLPKFIYLVYNYAPRFIDGAPHDTQEFLLAILDVLNTNCLENELNQENQNCKLETDHLPKNPSIMEEIFQGIDQSDVQCLRCHCISTTNSQFWDIQLDVANSGSLIDCLHQYTNIENLDQQYKCSKCDSLQKATKQLLLRKIPTVLTFHLKRFESTDKRVAKFSKVVEFPEVLDILPFMTKHKNENPNGTAHLTSECKNVAFNGKNLPFFDTKYILYGVVEHRGTSIEDGHYQAFVRLQHDEWYLCNDAIIKKKKIDEVLKSEGYLLFYHKMAV